MALTLKLGEAALILALDMLGHPARGNETGICESPGIVLSPELELMLLNTLCLCGVQSAIRLVIGIRN
ncbi:unnamed protein product [Clonostachys byssicola]|uniref:Uncharacterized protein n=1 Tax=Clonostachys byssicola TaxID=160290 RepID=A0A9N9Y4E2_9HYPO|nr:unnamed protein product [Clonostachys byssicola]